MKQRKSKGDKRITFRLPPDMLQAVKVKSRQERRSMNTQLLILVERGLAA